MILSRHSEKTLSTLREISDPKNSHLFSRKAALEAFAHVSGVCLGYDDKAL